MHYTIIVPSYSYLLILKIYIFFVSFVILYLVKMWAQIPQKVHTFTVWDCVSKFCHHFICHWMLYLKATSAIAVCIKCHCRSGNNMLLAFSLSPNILWDFSIGPGLVVGKEEVICSHVQNLLLMHNYMIIINYICIHIYNM